MGSKRRGRVPDEARPGATVAAPSAGPVTDGGLQRTVGNRAVTDVIQRLKVSGTEVGAIKLAVDLEGKLGKGTYGAVLGLLKAHPDEAFTDLDAAAAWATEQGVKAPTVTPSNPKASPPPTPRAPDVSGRYIGSLGQGPGSIRVVIKGDSPKRHGLSDQGVLALLEQNRSRLKTGPDNVLLVGDGIVRGYAKYGSIRYAADGRTIAVYHAHTSGAMG